MTIKNQTHIMLDLETMGTGVNAAIIAIGAVKFNPFEGTIDDIDKFHVLIDLNSSVKMGGAIEADTLFWWMRQSEEAKKQQFDLPCTHINNALRDFAYWARKKDNEQHPADHLKPKDIDIWGNGADFDNIILAQSFQRSEQPRPWRKNRCYRTIKDLYHHIPLERVGNHHNAVDDAESQARHLIEIFKHMNFKEQA